MLRLFPFVSWPDALADPHRGRILRLPDIRRYQMTHGAHAARRPRWVRPAIAIAVLLAALAAVVAVVVPRLTSAPAQGAQQAMVAPAPAVHPVVKAEPCAVPAAPPGIGMYVRTYVDPSTRQLISRRDPIDGPNAFLSYKPTRVPNGYRWVAQPEIGQLLAQVTYTDQSGRCVHKAVPVRYNQPITDMADVDPQAPLDLIDVPEPAGKLLGITIFPLELSPGTGEHFAVWSAPNHRMMVHDASSPWLVTSAAPSMTVTTRGTLLHWGLGPKYRKITVQVLYVRHDGVLDTYGATARRGGGTVDLTVPGTVVSTLVQGTPTI
jgi:hypothetical protein